MKIMKTVRFRGRAFIAVAISLVCIIALLRTSILTDDALDTAENPSGVGAAVNGANNINKAKSRRSGADGGNAVEDEDVVNNKDDTNVENKDRRAYYNVKKTKDTNENTINDDADVDAELKLNKNNENNKQNFDRDPSRTLGPIRGDHHHDVHGELAENRNGNDDGDVNHRNHNHNMGARHRNKGHLPQQPAFGGGIVGGFDTLNANITNGVYPIVVNGKFVPNRRIVHLDLKGAPPQLYYFEKFFAMIQKLGATGILIEYEDMFPYSGDLAITRSGQAYSDKDIRQIVVWAKEYGLEVIPLVQTFGHLEWILKHEKFAKYREVDRYAQVICLSNNDAVHLVKMAIDQVMAYHADTSEFFHMGADEAFQVSRQIL